KRPVSETLRLAFLVSYHLSRLPLLHPKSERHRQHHATPRKNADVISTVDGRGASSAEGIGIGCAVRIDRKRCRGTCDAVARDVVLVEQIVEAQAEIRLVEAA